MNTPAYKLVTKIINDGWRDRNTKVDDLFSHPPKILAELLLSHAVSPLGLNQAIQKLVTYINTKGKTQTPARREELRQALGMLSSRIDYNAPSVLRKSR